MVLQHRLDRYVTRGWRDYSAMRSIIRHWGQSTGALDCDLILDDTKGSANHTTLGGLVARRDELLAGVMASTGPLHFVMRLA